jgi:DNA processing protein
MNLTEERIEEIACSAALNEMRGLNQHDRKRLVNHFGNAASVFQSNRNELIKILEPKKNVAAIAEYILTYKSLNRHREDTLRTHEKGTSFLLYTDNDYPFGLKQINDPPLILYVRGNILPEDTISIALVGTRMPTNYGRTASSMLARELAAHSVTIISGLARGIDSEAHKSVIEAGGRTIAVMGTGIDITYPTENRKLREKIEQNGAVVTEFPPGAGPEPWRFPARNRIISGLTLGTVVVEAPEKSGALITARLSLEYNREVFAVPGCITSSKSSGCHKLIREGAKPVTRVEDILEEFDKDIFPAKSFQKKDSCNISAFSDNEKNIWKAVGEEGAIPEMIIQESGLSSAVVSSTLLQMELKSLVRRMPDNTYIRNVK